MILGSFPKFPGIPGNELTGLPTPGNGKKSRIPETLYETHDFQAIEDVAKGVSPVTTTIAMH